MEVLIAPEYDDEALAAAAAEGGAADPRATASAAAPAPATATSGACSAASSSRTPTPRWTTARAWRSSPTPTPTRRAGATCSSPGASPSTSPRTRSCIAHDLQTIGIGGGQTSRVDAVRLALQKAAEYGHDLDRRGARVGRLLPVPGRAAARARRGRRDDRPAGRLEAGRRGRRGGRGSGRGHGVHRRAATSGTSGVEAEPRGALLRVVRNLRHQLHETTSSEPAVEYATAVAREYPTVLDLVGGTPLVRLQRVGRDVGADAPRQARVPEPGRERQGPHRPRA